MDFEPTSGGSRRRSVRWTAALAAGVVAGVVLLILPYGLPWVVSGIIDPAIMGRQVYAGEGVGPGQRLLVGLLHMLVAIAYGFVIAPIVHRLRPLLAFVAGALAGAGLYAINYFVFAAFFPSFAGQYEAGTIVAHLVFGALAAGAYKGLAPRRAEAA